MTKNFLLQWERIPMNFSLLRRCWLMLALTLGGLSAADAQVNLLTGGAAPTPKPKFTTKFTPSEAKPGDEATLSIRVKLPKGYYIYSNSGEFGGRTMINITETGLDPIDAEFSPDHEPKTEFEPTLKVEVGKHFDEVTWSRKYKVQSNATEATVIGELEGMYCGGSDADNPACIPIRPAYEIDASIQLTAANPAATNSAASVPAYTQHLQPTRKIKKVDQPTPIAYDVALTPNNAQPGEKVTLSVTATVTEGWHTFSLTQKDLGGNPTEISVTNVRGLKAIDDAFHTDQPFETKIDDGNTLEIYHGSVTWSRTYEVLPDVKPGDYSARGEINAQYCDDQTCNLVSAEFDVGGQGGAPGQVAVAPPGPEKPETPRTEPPKALLPFLLLCMGGGFLALLTPCSFPMVPITVSFFLHQSEAGHKRPVLLAFVYCGTIVAAFTILGVGIAAFFGATSLTALANIPWLNLIIGTVFVIFALNMLGMFDIHMPGWLLTKTASQESTGSYLGAVFMALTFTLTSFTCTFAIAGTLLLGAAQGEVYWPVIGMFAFGSAFAAPFFVLAMIPGLLKKLPKSGGWMNSVKVVMGILELGAAVKFFSIADPGQVVLDHASVMVMWFVLAAVTGIYLFGWFRLPHDTASNSISPLRMLLGTTFFVLAGLLLSGLSMPERGGVAVRQILAFAPARIEAGAGELGPSLKHHGLEFALYFDKAVPVAKKQNRPMLIDFTGINCLNCRDMELKMGQPAWKDRIAKFVGVQLYVDTVTVPGISDRIEKKTNIKLQDELVENPAMPSYAVVSPDGKTVLATFIGAEPADGSRSFVKFLDEGWAKWEATQGKGGQAIGKLTDRKDEPFRQ